MGLLVVVFGVGEAVGAGPESPAGPVDRIFAADNRTDSPGCAVGVVRDGPWSSPRAAGWPASEIVVVRHGKHQWLDGDFDALCTALE